MSEMPSGTVTFLFTDLEASTRLWEAHTAEMEAGLERHDAILRGAIANHDGFIFSTAGDAFAAAFSSHTAAVDAAVSAQQQLAAEPWPEPVELRVRMGLHTGEAQERDGDYFGPTLNRAARLMSAGHGGQILVSDVTASLLNHDDLRDLGSHRLKDLSGTERIWQIGGADWPPLRTLDASPGNLPVQTTSFVGRDREVEQLTELMEVHRFVTLTGVGGVGKTRLAVRVGAELAAEFPDGVWLVELAPAEDPASVPDVVAAVLGVAQQPGLTVTESVAEALSGRRTLIVLDNCEHLLDAAADLVEAVLARGTSAKVLATSREGLRVEGEHLWAVPSLSVAAGVTSAAVELFTERARAVAAGFSLDDEAEAAAVTEICQRLDGIALAIELAAARMVSMSAGDVRDRLDDRFRLLSGSPRGLERHQTLRHAVAWSFELLNDDERGLLSRCSVFADGFDLAAASQICGDDLDEFAVLDVVDSLVRKSLVTTEQALGHTRYRLLETIRQFANDQLAATGAIGDVRDRHARYFADQAIRYFEVWEGLDQLIALDWVDVEFANLRTGFRWAADQNDLSGATAIAAHTSLLTRPLQRYEPVGWAEEILAAAAAVDLPQLPRLYTAATLCQYVGRPEMAVGYAETAVALEADLRYDPFESGWSGFWGATAHLYSGQGARGLAIFAELATETGLAHVDGLCGMLYTLPAVGRAEEAMVIAEETVAAAREFGNPMWVAFALTGYGRAYTESDPARALAAWREGLAYSREHRLSFMEALIAPSAALLEGLHGDLDRALALFDTTIDSFHRAGDHGNVGSTLAHLAMFFDRVDQPEIAATVYGTSTHYGSIDQVINLAGVVAHLPSVLGEATFSDCLAAGAAMDISEAVQYAHGQIQLARDQLPEPA